MDKISTLRANLHKFSVVDAQFATSLIKQYDERGTLSDKQLYWVNKLADRITATEPTATFSAMPKVIAALNAAHNRGIKRPAFRVTQGQNTYVFKRAPDTGRNPGMVYVTDHTLAYLGKVDTTGAFTKSRDCGSDAMADLEAIADDPLAKARESGKLTGSCSCCGRVLSDPASIQDGIGPICKNKFFGE